MSFKGALKKPRTRLPALADEGWLVMSESRNRVVALLRAKVTEQATRQEAHQALEKDSCQVDDCELDQVLHHLCETDVIKLDEHGTLHLLL